MDNRSTLARLRALSARQVFVLDGLGALLTASLNVLLLPRLADHLPFPPWLLAALTVAAASFSAYSLSCAYFARDPRPYLPPIIAANALYCLTTLAAAWLLPGFSALGFAYVAGEVIVVSCVVALEIACFRRGSEEDELR